MMMFAPCPRTVPCPLQGTEDLLMKFTALKYTDALSSASSNYFPFVVLRGSVIYTTISSPFF